MPCGEYCAGNGCGRQSSEVCFCQAGCQTGVLHTNFDGQSNSLFPAEAGEAGDGKAKSVTAAVMQNNYQQNQAGSLQNQVAAGADNTCDNQRNCNGGYSWQIVGSCLGRKDLTARPKQIGRITIWTMLQNMPTGSKLIFSPIIM